MVTIIIINSYNLKIIITVITTKVNSYYLCVSVTGLIHYMHRLIQSAKQPWNGAIIILIYISQN